jgi:ubiquinone biosynthesis protein COQ9
MAEVRVRDRVAAVVRLRIEVIAPYREAVARGVSFQMLPFNAPVAIKCLFHTVDSLWRAAGDRATDFTYYTKRLTLAGLWSTTLLYWLADHSPEYEATWRFLDRRLDATLTCGRLVADLNDLAARMPDPFRFLGGFRRPRQ